MSEKSSIFHSVIDHDESGLHFFCNLLPFITADMSGQGPPPVAAAATDDRAMEVIEVEDNEEDDNKVSEKSSIFHSLLIMMNQAYISFAIHFQEFCQLI